MPRLSRVLRLLQLLREDPPVTVDVLAERLGVSRRTVFRDLTTIRQAGGVVTHEPGRGYRLTRMALGTWQPLEAREALALTVLHRHLRSRPEDPILSAAARPLGEILDSADERVREACRALGGAIEIVEPTTPSNTDGGLITRALRAAESRASVDLVIEETDGERVVYERIQDGRLERIGGQWYFTGVPPSDDSRRRFSLDSILSISECNRADLTSAREWVDDLV